MIMVALVILAILFATPQGRTLAQNILLFFTRSDSSSISLVAPVRVTLVDVNPSVSLPTRTPTPGKPLPFAAQCGDTSFPTCSLAQIRSLVKFTVNAINDVPVPSDLNFIGATGGPDQVWLVYRSEDKTRAIFLIEGTKVEQGFQGFEIAADTIVESVQDHISYWSIKNGLLSLARGLTTTLATPTPEPINDLLSIAEAKPRQDFMYWYPNLIRFHAGNTLSAMPVTHLCQKPSAWFTNTRMITATRRVSPKEQNQRPCQH